MLVGLTAHWPAQCWATREGKKSRNGAVANDGCSFPDRWHADYFLANLREPFTVRDMDFGTQGFCFRKHTANKFTVYNRPNKCFHCIQVSQRVYYYFRTHMINTRCGNGTRMHFSTKWGRVLQRRSSGGLRQSAKSRRQLLFTLWCGLTPARLVLSTELSISLTRRRASLASSRTAGWSSA